MTCSETQNITFEAELSHTGIDVAWIFGKQELKTGPKCKVEAKGKLYKLTVLNVMKDEEGEYTFIAGEKTSKANLTVSGTKPFFDIMLI